MKIFNIPGTSFSVRRVIGIDKIKRNISKATGIPTTKQGLEMRIPAQCRPGSPVILGHLC